MLKTDAISQLPDSLKTISGFVIRDLCLVFEPEKNELYLRHVFAQTLLNEGVRLENIQTLLGHQSFKTTQKRYAMFARPDLLDEASNIDNVIQITDNKPQKTKSKQVG